PTGVSNTRRRLRSKRITPSDASSRAIWPESAGCEMWQSRAAARKFKCLAVVTKHSSCRTEGRAPRSNVTMGLYRARVATHHLVHLIQDRLRRLEQERQVLAHMHAALRLLIQNARSQRLTAIIVGLVIEHVGAGDFTHRSSPYQRASLSLRASLSPSASRCPP